MLAGDFIHQLDQVIQGNLQFTISVASDSFVSESLYYHKLHASWVPKMLFDHHKTQQLGANLMFLQSQLDGEIF